MKPATPRLFVMDDSKKPAMELRRIVFPDCARQCRAIEHLGAGECENMCPWKFDKNGDQRSQLENDDG